MARTPAEQVSGRTSRGDVQAIVQAVVQQIVARFHPQKVILLGSRAYGTPTADSDADLLVIMETTERPLRAAARIAAAIDHPVALDILVRTPDEIARRRAAGDTFIVEVLSRGTVLYEARGR